MMSRGGATTGVIMLAFFLGMFGWFTYDRCQCMKRFAQVATAYDTLLVAEMHSCEFAAMDDLARIRGQMMERCHNRGGYWLGKPIQVGTTQTRCIVGPQSVPLSDVEATPR